MLEKLALWLRGLPGGACELNTEDPGGYGFQLNAQKLGAVVFNFLQDRVGPAPVRPNWFKFRPDRAVVAEILRLYRHHGSRGLVAIVAEEDTHGHDGEALTLVKDLRAEIGQEKVLLADPAWIEPDKSILGQEVTVAFRDVTVPTLIREYLAHGVPLKGLLALACEGRVINPFGTTPAGTREAMVVLARQRGRLSRLVRQLTGWARPLSAALTEDISRDPSGYVLKHEGTYSGKGVLIGGVHDAEIYEVLANGVHEGWVVERKLDPAIWSDEFTLLEAGQRRGRQTLDLRVLVAGKGFGGFLCRFNENPPTNVGSGGGVQSFLVVPGRREAQTLREWYRRALDQIGLAELRELENQLTNLARELGHWYHLGPIRGTLEPRILTRAEVWYLSQYARQLWQVCLWLCQNWRELGIELDEGVAGLVELQPFTGQPAVLAADLLVGAGTSWFHKYK